MKVALVLFASTAFCLATLAASGQSVSGLRIGDKASKLTLLQEKPSAIDTYKSMTVQKWVLPGGNELSVTTSMDGLIVYLESDWNGKSPGTGCDLPGLKFGVTTLADLRMRFGSNGFEFKNRGGVIKTPDGVVMLNSYEIGSVVVTFITKVNQDEYQQAQKSSQHVEVAEFARLDAISYADAEYAKDEWGERIYDPDYKKADWR